MCLIVITSNGEYLDASTYEYGTSHHQAIDQQYYLHEDEDEERYRDDMYTPRSSSSHNKHSDGSSETNPSDDDGNNDDDEKSHHYDTLQISDCLVAFLFTHIRQYGQTNKHSRPLSSPSSFSVASSSGHRDNRGTRRSRRGRFSSSKQPTINSFMKQSLVIAQAFSSLSSSLASSSTVTTTDESSFSSHSLSTTTASSSSSSVMSSFTSTSDLISFLLLAFQQSKTHPCDLPTYKKQNKHKHTQRPSCRRPNITSTSTTSAANMLETIPSRNKTTFQVKPKTLSKHHSFSSFSRFFVQLCQLFPNVEELTLDVLPVILPLIVEYEHGSFNDYWRLLAYLDQEIHRNKTNNTLNECLRDAVISFLVNCLLGNKRESVMECAKACPREGSSFAKHYKLTFNLFLTTLFPEVTDSTQRKVQYRKLIVKLSSQLDIVEVKSLALAGCFQRQQDIIANRSDNISCRNNCYCLKE